MSNMSRPGVEASRRLAKIRDVKIWDAIERQYDLMIVKKGGVKLRQLDGTREALGKKWTLETNNPSICLDELFQVVEWKFGKGKPRHALWKHLKSIQEKDLKAFSTESFQKATQGDVKGAIDDLSKLSGVGPATASAILSVYRPDIFSFMDDEVIEALYEDGKRGYTVKIYLQVNSKCHQIAGDLNELLGSSLWSCNRVGRALWTASQLCATGGEDLTVHVNEHESSSSGLSSSRATTRQSKHARKEQGNTETAATEVGRTKRRKKDI